MGEVPSSQPGKERCRPMTPSKDHLSNVDISTVYLGILNITLHKINQNMIKTERVSMQSPLQREITRLGRDNAIILRSHSLR